MDHLRRFWLPEIIVAALALILLNLGLWQGEPNAGLVYFPDRIADGEWWRLLTHPLIHVSQYHLMLDGAAFLLLYATLNTGALWRRLGYVVACGAGSLLLSQALSSIVPVSGLCGLSGIAHGLMAVGSLEMLWVRSSRKVGALILSTVILKSLIELLSGDVLFSSQHVGSIGRPVVESHAGGVIGGIIGFNLFKEGDRSEAPIVGKPCLAQTLSHQPGTEA
jgi:rhomboid family GlyGly-CTERM serine protease